VPVRSALVINRHSVGISHLRNKNSIISSFVAAALKCDILKCGQTKVL
jgi:hypothetical protein